MSFIEMVYTKNPADERTIPFRYNWLINNPTYAGYSLDTYTFSVLDEGAVSHPEMINGTPWNDSLFLYLPVKGGNDGLDYYVKGVIIFKKTGSPDFVKEWQLLIQVRQEGI